MRNRNRNQDLFEQRDRNRAAALAVNPDPSGSRVKQEYASELRQDQMARRFAMRTTASSGNIVLPQVKRERWEDDDRREGRGLQRVRVVSFYPGTGARTDTQGLEGGADEELDYDVNEDFQDDDDVNTFYRNADEEEDAKLQDVSEKRFCFDA